MDLREKASVLQRISEYSIRFRLIEILLALVLCIVALFNINGVFENIAIDFSINYVALNAALALIILRYLFFGFKIALFLLFFLVFNGLLFFAFAEFKEFAQIILLCILAIAAAAFFFSRNQIVKSIFPLVLLVYSLSAWLLFLGVSNLAWFGIISVFCADVFSLKGTLAQRVRKIIPASLLTVVLLIALDSVLFYMGLQMLSSKDLPHSIAIYASYVLWMPFFAAALFSFCRLGNR